MVQTLKVAFATTDRKHVNQHFGSASAFVIYAVTPAQAGLLGVAQFDDLLQDGHEDKLAAKLELLQGCDAVYCQAVGGSAIRQLLQRGIQPLRVEEGVAIDHLLGELQQECGRRCGCRRREPVGQWFGSAIGEGWQE